MNQNMKGVSPTRHVNAAFDSTEWSSTHLKSKLVQIDQYLDIDKLIQDIRKQDKDSYGIRCLLDKVKEHSKALLQIETQLQVKQQHLRKSIENATCVQCKTQ